MSVSSPDQNQKENQNSAEHLNAFAIERLSRAFETSAKRWELILYPTLFAFIILAAYGFYLVFSLAKDVHYLVISVDTNMTIMASNMQSITTTMNQMGMSMRTIAANMDSMARDVNTLPPMLSSMRDIDNAIQHITISTSSMRNDMAVMNQSISRPMQFMNWVMPW